MEEQRDGSPLCREVGDGGRTERRTLLPLDPATTRDHDDEDEIVELGSRTRDTTADDQDGDDEIVQRRSPDHRRSCSAPSQRVRQTTAASAASTTTSTHVRSVVTRPARAISGIGRGAGLLQPGRQFLVGTADADNSTVIKVVNKEQRSDVVAECMVSTHVQHNNTTTTARQFQ
jgi:hypothetical protein